MTAHELARILLRAPDVPVCWAGPGGALAVEVTAAVLVDRVTFLPAGGLVAVGPVVLLGEVLYR